MCGSGQDLAAEGRGLESCSDFGASPSLVQSLRSGLGRALGLRAGRGLYPRTQYECGTWTPVCRQRIGKPEPGPSRVGLQEATAALNDQLQRATELPNGAPPQGG